MGLESTDGQYGLYVTHGVPLCQRPLVSLDGQYGIYITNGVTLI